MPNTAFEPEIFNIPMPMDFDDEPLGDVVARAETVCRTAEAIAGHMLTSGQEIKTDPIDSAEARSILTAPTAKDFTSPRTKVSFILSGLLDSYDREFVTNAKQIRNICINTLLEAVASGKTTEKLRAVELLGKVADVGLFVERTHQVIEHRPDEELKQILKEKLNKIRALEAVQVQAPTEPVDVDFKEVGAPP